jgi:hypothetical protein
MKKEIGKTKSRNAIDAWCVMRGQRASRAQSKKLPGEILNSISRAKETLKY